MSRIGFIAKPWATESVHAAYAKSMLHMRPAPEYASGEVVLASTYRRVGFESITEGKVPTHGRAFDKAIKSGKRPRGQTSAARTDEEAWRGIMKRTLQSPKQPNQRTKRFLQLTPLVPDLVLYAQSARLSTNSWNAGNLVERMIRFGSTSDDAAGTVWSQLFAALSVDMGDDLWARYLSEELSSWRNPKLDADWELTKLETGDAAVAAWNKPDGMGGETPAHQFALDLPTILSIKDELTRRQWVSLIEALLRLATASHILWVCQANIVCFDLLKRVIRGDAPPAPKEVANAFSITSGVWRYGQLAGRTMTDMATGFVKARAGINLLLHTLEDVSTLQVDQDCLGNPVAMHGLATHLCKESNFDRKQFLRDYEDVIENDRRLVSGKKGISANVKEFLRHVLGKRQTNEPGLDSYDQGYVLAKRGSHNSAPWVVSLGPVAVLTVTRACTAGGHGMRTVSDLCHHLSHYGINVRAHDVPRLALGATLRNLGLVLDSPDAEGGMVLVNPFDSDSRSEAT